MKSIFLMIKKKMGHSGRMNEQNEKVEIAHL